jgi:hypothetical protein
MDTLQHLFERYPAAKPYNRALAAMARPDDIGASSRS